VEVGSKSSPSLDDVAFLETLAAALTRDAEQSESAEADLLTGQHTASRSAVAARAAENRLSDLELDTSTDRRRPGRRDDVDPALIPLLREETIESLPFEGADKSFDNLRASHGVIIWVLVSAATWISMGLWVALGR
jgi:hypothetical protein